MKQPELGARICEIRNAAGITQKELSESCHVDVRTIQRIETGEVTPRFSTLKLIAAALSCDVRSFNGDQPDSPEKSQDTYMPFWLVAGLVYFVTWVLVTPLFPKGKFFDAVYLITSSVYTLSGVLFYYGFFLMGKGQHNRILQVSSVGVMLLIPLFFVAELIGFKVGFARDVMRLVVVLMGINGIAFGIGLLKVRNQWTQGYRVAGLLQLVTVPFLIIPLPVMSMVGCWLSLPFVFLLVTLVFLEYREWRHAPVTAPTA